MQNNPPGYVPDSGQGIEARKRQHGVLGGKSWLKSVKLHKYWPTFSHWSYSEILSLEEWNIDLLIAKTGSSGMTLGAKRRLLKLVHGLRLRQEVLDSLPMKLEYGLIQPFAALAYLREVVGTPLSTDPTDSLPESIVSTFIQVYDYVQRLKGSDTFTTLQLDSISRKILERPVLNLAAAKLFISCTHRRRYWPFETFRALRDKRTCEPRKNVRSKRHISSDSGFDETDSWYSQSEIVWPAGENNVMFTEWKCTTSPLHPDSSSPSTSRDSESSSRFEVGSWSSSLGRFHGEISSSQSSPWLEKSNRILAQPQSSPQSDEEMEHLIHSMLRDLV